jgi:FdhD protein
MPESSSQHTNKVIYVKGNRQVTRDLVITEQPLQICISFYEQSSLKNVITEQLQSSTFSITMRTPGHDEQLILGLLLSEGVISSINDIEEITREPLDEENTELASTVTSDNSWEVKLAKGVSLNIVNLERYQMTYSSCGLCGTTSLKSLELKSPPKSPKAKAWLDANKIGLWPILMKEQQALFKKTGGAHAAALFDQFGSLLDIKEDIGRHNAVDKLLGELLKTKTNNLTKRNLAIVVSSRVSFEIVQKTIMSGIGVLIAVGAVSNLAISAAKRFDLTLIGFTTADSFNLYNGEWRMMQNSEGL